MSVAEAVMEKLSALPPQKQEQVLHYVESLNRPAKTAPTDADPYEWLKIAASMTLDRHAAVHELLQAGRSQREAAEIPGLSRNTVNRFARQASPAGLLVKDR